MFSLLLQFVLLSLIPAGCGRPDCSVHRETRMLMGTVVSVEIGAANRAQVSEILDPVWKQAVSLEKIFSRYQSESEVSRINRQSSFSPVEISEPMKKVLAESERISRLTGGAFDITVAPLMELWGFFPKREGKLPPPEELEEVSALVGWEGVGFDPKAGTVSLAEEGMAIDLGGVAKGYIVDRMVESLRKKGVKSALVNAGGDIYGLGERPGGGPWRIGVEHPRREGELISVIELKDRAVATSGDYRNYFIRGKKRYSHIIDPRTGKPARNGVIEVSIIAPDCLTADGLATAVSILEVEKGLEIINRLEGVEGIIVVQNEKEPRIFYSRGIGDE